MPSKVFFCGIAPLVLSVFLLVSQAPAQTLSLSWQPRDDNVAGYQLHYQAGSPESPFSGLEALEGRSPLDMGGNTTATLTLPDDGRIYYFAVTAYNTEGQESSYSNIVANRPIPNLLTPAPASQDVPLFPTLSWFYEGSDPETTFTLYYGTDPDLPLDTALASALNEPIGPPLAAALGLLSWAFLGSGRIRRRAWRHLPALVLCLGLFVMTACGSDGTGGFQAPAGDPGEIASPSEPGTPESSDTVVVEGIVDLQYIPEDLEPGTTYYWKVVAVDSWGERAESPVSRFTTAAQAY